MSDLKKKTDSVAESPSRDVFEGRNPSQSEKDWAEQTLGPALEKSPERPIGRATGSNLDENGHARFSTISNVPIRRLYTPADLPEDWSYDQHLNYPGQEPYTRGIHATGYRGKLWTMRQFSGFASPEESNERYKFLLAHGGGGLSVAFDLPTLMGYDSDHPFSEGEVGKCGVAIDSLEDMEILFDGIDLEKTTVSMTINSPASILWAMYLAVAEKQGADWKKISGTLQNDILKEYIAQKEYIYPPAPSMRLVIDTFEFGSKYTPRFNTISISGYHIREAGSTALQELAFTIYDGVEYVEWSQRRGLDVDEFGPRLSFFFNAHNDFFEEIAKYRAARKIWYRLMRDRFGAKNERTWLMRFHTQTAGVSLTAQQTQNNIARVALQALAAVLGGTQSLHTDSFDEALALPTAQAAQIALRTQQIIAYESGVANTIDPLGGSYFVEKFTLDMEKGAFDYFDKLDAMGGMVKAIEKGYPQKEIAEASYQFQKAAEAREKVIVGANEFIVEGQPSDTLYIDESVGEAQTKKLKALRSRRDNASVQRALDALKKAAAQEPKAGENGNISPVNTMPFIVDAVKAYATVGEICDALRSVYGTYEESAFA
ncbi:methylmalonyl-CoA mutase [Candidatus Koribacter versatilis Ellin345]|uniref:Methylmalonyl-CoA mutase n=1 Tax=Koribacter versatilis (strain Ellin345) TaxID=204669 RepID=Q1IRP4_KORVE|nr:methylmalonyl-CoA mutase family protein [Candidatus Koribacter versatilis]ABF40456.1 methylmalonyl-CoA mutase [Candidatus Koribacter versatilis Ellin345]